MIDEIVHSVVAGCLCVEVAVVCTEIIGLIQVIGPETQILGLSKRIEPSSVELLLFGVVRVVYTLLALIHALPHLHHLHFPLLRFEFFLAFGRVIAGSRPYEIGSSIWIS